MKYSNVVRAIVVIGGILLLIAGSYAYSRIGADSAKGELSLQQSFSHSHGIAADPSDPSKLYIATHEGLYVLVGEKDLYRIGKKRDDLMGFTAHPTESGVFFSSGHPVGGGNIGFQKTTDAGVTWKKISNGLMGPVDFHALAVSEVNPDIVYGLFRGLQRSVDGGKTWEFAKGSVRPHSLSTDPTRENVVYAATENGVLVSEDRGDSWKSLSQQLEGGAVLNFLSIGDGITLAFSERLGGLGRSDDNGGTWKKVNENFGGSAVTYLAYGKAASVIYALTDSHEVWKSSDRGETWAKVR